MANGHGGKRAGAGLPKGTVLPKTLEKAEAKRIADQILRDELMKHWPEMVQAQAAHSKGVAYMVLRHPDGTFTRATDEKQIDAALAGEATFRIFTQAPNTQAFTALSDRAFDKPKEPEQDINLKVTGDLMAKVEAARKRAKK